VSADINNAAGATIGEVDMEPVTIGGGITYRF
jgi:outer membrane protein